MLFTKLHVIRNLFIALTFILLLTNFVTCVPSGDIPASTEKNGLNIGSSFDVFTNATDTLAIRCKQCPTNAFEILRAPIAFQLSGAGTAECASFTNFGENSFDCVITGQLGVGAVYLEIPLMNGITVNYQATVISDVNINVPCEFEANDKLIGGAFLSWSIVTRGVSPITSFRLDQSDDTGIKTSYVTNAPDRIFLGAREHSISQNATNWRYRLDSLSIDRTYTWTVTPMIGSIELSKSKSISLTSSRHPAPPEDVILIANSSVVTWRHSSRNPFYAIKYYELTMEASYGRNRTVLLPPNVMIYVVLDGTFDGTVGDHRISMRTIGFYANSRAVYAHVKYLVSPEPTHADPYNGTPYLVIRILVILLIVGGAIWWHWP